MQLCLVLETNIREPTVMGVKQEHWEMQWKLAQYVPYFVVIKLLYTLSERDFLS